MFSTTYILIFTQFVVLASIIILYYMYSALFSKLYRINKLFAGAKGFKRVTITIKEIGRAHV